VLCGTALD